MKYQQGSVESLLLWPLVSTNPKEWAEEEKFGKSQRNNSRGKEKHGKKVSPKPIIKVVSRKNGQSAVSSKSSSEMCPCAWQPSHMEAPVSAAPEAPWEDKKITQIEE